MAILPNYFDPAMYGSPMGGLLGNLPMYQTQIGPSDGFPGAPTDMSAQSRAPMAAQPGPWDRFLGGLSDNSDMLMMLGAGIMQGGLGKGLQLGAQSAQAAGKRATTDDIKEFEYAKSQGFKGGFQDWMARKRAGAGEYGLNPIWGRDKDGNPVMLQAGKSGEAIQTRLPEGVSLSGKEPIKFDAGTHFVLMDPLTRQTIGVIPKNIAEAKAQEEIGKLRGPAEINLPTTLAKAEQALGVIDQMIAHPGREAATGLSSRVDPRNYIAGTDATDFNVMSRQLQGKAFLEAFESLKGGGQITEVEGQKATEAIGRLSTAQSEEAYLAALRELRGIIVGGMARARQKAGVAPAAPAPATPAPADPLGIR